jgi:hypothetical protein
MDLQHSDFCCNNGYADKEDFQTGLSDTIIYQNHVAVFLTFPVCGVWFNFKYIRKEQGCYLCGLYSWLRERVYQAVA